MKHSIESIAVLVISFVIICSLLFPSARFASGVASGNLFSDGFESGNFNHWSGTVVTSGETAAVVSTLSYDGGFSAMFTSNGSSGTEKAYCYEAVSPTNELYVRGYFYLSQSGIVGESDRFYVLGILAGTNNPVAYAGWIETGGIVEWALEIRNGTNSVFAYSSASIPSNQWYCVELHWAESATAGRGDLWVNGINVCTISGKNTSAFGDANSVRFGLPLLEGCAATIVYGDSCVYSNAYVGPELGAGTLQAYTVFRIVLSSYSDGFNHTNSLPTIEVIATEMTIITTNSDMGVIYGSYPNGTPYPYKDILDFTSVEALESWWEGGMQVPLNATPPFTFVSDFSNCLGTSTYWGSGGVGTLIVRPNIDDFSSVYGTDFNKPTNKIYVHGADSNGDGKITLADLVHLANVYAQRTTWVGTLPPSGTFFWVGE